MPIRRPAVLGLVVSLSFASSSRPAQAQPAAAPSPPPPAAPAELPPVAPEPENMLLLPQWTLDAPITNAAKDARTRFLRRG